MDKINGRQYAAMIIAGAARIYQNRGAVDDMNVFPVPDGDTGTNMSMTMKAAAEELKKRKPEAVSGVADAVAYAALRGARGNSGVILSQLFRGMAKGLSDCDEADGYAVARALKSGADAAYKAVMKPTEGTILTVAREAAEYAVKYGSEDVTETMEAAVSGGEKALEKTKTILPILKKAGVADAGGRGWLYILEGALSFLENGAEADFTATEELQKPVRAAAEEQINFRYCTEFIIEKQPTEKTAEDFKTAIEDKGDCVLVIDGGDIIKVHIHTNNPGYVLEQAVKFGELVNIKIDNMKRQHRSILEESPIPKFEDKTSVTVKPKGSKREPKRYGFAAVCAGAGFEDILKELGADRIIEGGQTMNPSAEDILNAAAKINARRIFVFPNNKNIILAARQAAELSDKKITVIPTNEVTECIAALIAFDNSLDADKNEKIMTEAAARIKTGKVTEAVRDADGLQVKKGDIIGLCGGKITAVGQNPQAVCSEVIERLCDDDTEYVTIYYGSGIKKRDAQRVAEITEEYAEDIEAAAKRGAQPIYMYIVSAEQSI